MDEQIVLDLFNGILVNDKKERTIDIWMWLIMLPVTRDPLPEFLPGQVAGFGSRVPWPERQSLTATQDGWSQVALVERAKQSGF